MDFSGLENGAAIERHDFNARNLPFNNNRHVASGRVCENFVRKRILGNSIDRIFLEILSRNSLSLVDPFFSFGSREQQHDRGSLQG